MSGTLSPSFQHARGLATMVLSAAALTANVILIRALSQVQSVNVWLISCTCFVVGKNRLQQSHTMRHAFMYASISLSPWNGPLQTTTFHPRPRNLSWKWS